MYVTPPPRGARRWRQPSTLAILIKIFDLPVGDALGPLGALWRHEVVVLLEVRHDLLQLRHLVLVVRDVQLQQLRNTERET